LGGDGSQVFAARKARNVAFENGWSKVLSPREHEIALLAGRGLSNKGVARELGLSPGTIKTHVHSILMKLGERNRQRLILMQL
jgi:DNA-binding NarL/FixJ family response regulator